MFQYLRKAVSGSSVQDPRNNLVRDEYRKKQLKESLALQIKNLQRAHVNGSRVIERDDEDALKVCVSLEAIFLHEYINRGPTMDLKNMFVDGIRTTDDDTLHISFWEMVKEVTHNDVVTQLKHLVVTTEVGLCRSWVRLAMNDCLMVSYLDAIVFNKDQLMRYYGPNAFLMDAELTYILKELLQGLMEFEFRLNYNSSKLNTWDMEPLQLSGLVRCSSTGNFETGQKGGNCTKEPQTARLKDVAATKRTKSDGKKRKSVSSDQKETSEKSRSKESKSVSITSSSNSEDSTKYALSSKNKILSVEDLPGLSPGGFLQQKSRNENLDQQDHSSEGETESKFSFRESGNAPTENSSNEKSIHNETEKEHQPAGNRLGGNGWLGWSSQFEQTEVQNNGEIDATTPSHTEEIKSFDSLLQLYGNNATSKDDDDQVAGFIDVEDAGNNEKRTVAGFKKSKSIDKPDSPKSPSSDLSVIQTFEVVPMSSTICIGHVEKKTQSSSSQLIEIGQEMGLDFQHFKCKHCGKAIGLIYGPYRVCYFDGGYYCLDCHVEDEYYIPAKIVQNWDFGKHRVSKYNKVFLMKIEEEPLFHMDELNPTLYEIVSELKEIKLLRIQLQHVREYVQTCRNDVAEDFRIRLWPREYLCDDIHQYSLLDLIQVHNGQLANQLKKIISQFSKHIYKCTLCREKGFICEYCHDKEIIYPFQVGIAVQCPGCLATFHRACRKDKRCPKCVRIHLRLQIHKENDMDRKLVITSKEKYENSEIF